MSEGFSVADLAAFDVALGIIAPGGLVWRDVARPEQLAPVGEWLVWLFLAGRGAGKTRSAAEQVVEWARFPSARIALVGRTPADVRDVMIEGESGILAVSGVNRPLFEPTKRRLTWPNGAIATAYSAEVPSQLRGPQHTHVWADEVSSWSDAPKGDTVDTAWNNLMLGLRLGRDPRAVVTTTPKSNLLTRTIMGRHSTVITRGSTYDNLENLAPSFREQVLSTYEGTRIGRQELDGELLEAADGALWSVESLDANRLKEVPDLRRIVVAVDPSGGAGVNNDEQGIIVAGVADDGQFYVLADRSCKLSPQGWAQRAVTAYREFSADRIVAEKNFGGDMVESTITQIDSSVPVRMVNASRGKMQRAEPIAALYEQGRVHHIGLFPELEDQMVTWTPAQGGSPDRMDALVWAISELLSTASAAGWTAFMRKQSEPKESKVPAPSAEIVAGEPLTRAEVRQLAFNAGRYVRS